MHSSPARHRTNENKVLAALGNLQSPHFHSQLERVSLNQGEIIYELNVSIDYIYFPETAVFSMIATMEDGDTVEVGPVGDEGMLGLNVYFGECVSPNRVIVHVAGSALRVKAGVLREELHREKSPLPPLLLRYTQMLLAMTGQGSACNKLHSLEQQLARWLMMMHDYVGDELLLTHELLALTLGVRRAGVSNAASDLKKERIIDYQRGHIQILDRARLQARVCECYGVIKDEYDRLYADLPRLAT